MTDNGQLESSNSFSLRGCATLGNVKDGLPDTIVNPLPLSGKSR